jgi:hypothetical protein
MYNFVRDTIYIFQNAGATGMLLHINGKQTRTSNVKHTKHSSDQRSQITTDMFSLSYSQYVVSSFMNYHRVSNKIKTTDAISGATSVTSLC